jgi:carbon monoxide dehydrogenase subunit G
MKVNGQININLSREEVFIKLSDAKFFATCIEGISNLEEKGIDLYTALLETKVAYIKLKFEITVQITDKVFPSLIIAKSEGIPTGIVGRLVTISSANLIENKNGTIVNYEIDITLTGKLGSLGQPVIRSKIKEFEKQFTINLKKALNLAEE